MGRSRRSFLKSLGALVAGALPLRTAAALAPALGVRAWMRGFEPPGYYVVVMHPQVALELRAEGFEIGRLYGVHIIENVTRHG